MKRWIERTVSLKNRTIENLLQELEDAEEQYANNLQAHLSHIDDMLGRAKSTIFITPEVFFEHFRQSSRIYKMFKFHVRRRQKLVIRKF